jgi:glutamate dehydrogenase
MVASVPDDLEDEYDDVPNGESLIAAAVASRRPLVKTGSPTHSWCSATGVFAPDEELVDLTPGQLLAAARAHRELAQRRKPGDLKLRLTLVSDQHHSVVELVTDDMPFLVDSITGALSARNLDVQLLVHPVMVVRRDESGELIEVRSEVEPTTRRPATWSRAGCGWRSTRSAIRTIRVLQENLLRVLEDVRCAVQDWPRCGPGDVPRRRDRRRRAARARPRHHRLRRALRWLADDHFTFLGYREYELAEDGNIIRAVLGTGLGILRGDSRGATGAVTMTPEAYQKVLGEAPADPHEGELALDGPPHAYLDYIGSRPFDGTAMSSANGASSACSRRRPTARACATCRGAPQGRRASWSARAEPAQPLRQGSAGDPRDLSARRAVPDHHRRPLPHASWASCAWPGAGQLRLFLRKDRSAASSRAWSTCPATASPPRTGCASRRSCCAS